MRYQGRVVDPVALWANYVEFPGNFSVDENDEFLPLVVCPNPDHHTDKRHFQINVHKPLVHCFANCGISGTYEHAIAMIEGVTHREARKRVLKHSRIGKSSSPRRKKSAAPVQPILDLAAYDSYLPAIATEFLDRRGISPATRAAFDLRWDADERRIVIPVTDSRGRLRLLIKRAVREKDHPKYLYTEGVARNGLLFGTGQIDPGMVKSRGIVLVEGSFDSMVLHQHGVRNSVAILGSKLSEIQARQIAALRPPRIYTMFDADAAGIEAMISVAYRIRNTPIRVCRYPKGKLDPAELSQKEAERSIERAISLTEFKKRTGLSFKTRSSHPTRERISFG